MRRTALTVVIALGWLLAMSQPASAHSVSGVGANNWKTVITGVAPHVAGLSLKVVEGGSRLVLTNTGSDPSITVTGNYTRIPSPAAWPWLIVAEPRRDQPRAGRERTGASTSDAARRARCRCIKPAARTASRASGSGRWEGIPSSIERAMTTDDQPGLRHRWTAAVRRV